MDEGVYMTKQEINSSKELPIMEYFYTIQGEGFFSGRAAFFIRTAGCDVGCVHARGGRSAAA